MFFFRNQKIYMDAFTDRPEVHEFAPIDKAVKYIPTWWKNLPSREVSFNNYDLGQQRTMRHCVGFIDYFKKSYVIPMWSDLNLHIGEEGNTSYRWQFADGTSSITVHSASQRGVYLDEKKYQHLKLASPWIIKTNRLMYFSWTGAIWNSKEPEKIICFPAVNDFYYQCSTSINIACKRETKEQEIFIPFRQPLVHLIPMTEKEVVLKTHLVSELEMEKIHKSTFHPVTFTNTYLKLRKTKNAT